MCALPADGRGDGLAAALVVVRRLRLRLRRRGGGQQLRHLGRLSVRHRHLDDRRSCAKMTDLKALHDIDIDGRVGVIDTSF